MARRDHYGFKRGDHLVSGRFWYEHHGIYIGRGRVIHYAGLSDGLSGAPIVKTSLAAFANGHEIEVQPHGGRRYGRRRTVERARSRLGEDCYSVIFNNCEHFVNWCIEGEHRSDQVRNASLLAVGLAALAGGAAYASDAFDA